MNFDLPPLDATAKPAFDSEAACRAWVAALPAATPTRVQLDVLAQLKILARCQLDPKTRLALLDTLWVPVKSVQDAATLRFSDKLVPLESGLQNQFLMADSLWLELVRCHLRVVVDSPDTKSLLGAAIQRSLDILYRRQLDCARARQNLPASNWHMQNQLLALAEQVNVATTPVEDAPRYGPTPVPPLAPYGAAALLHAAGPYGLRALQLGWVERWARRWGGKLSLRHDPPIDLKSVPVCIDIESDQPPAFRPATGPGARFLETAELRKSIMGRLTMLDQGSSPEELQLGRDCTQPETGVLLKKLLAAWCQGGVPRRVERKPGTPGGRLLAGSEAIFDELSGGRSRVPATDLTSTDLRKQREAMAVFGSTRGVKVNVPQRVQSPQLKIDWAVFDESAGGLRLERALDAPAEPIDLGQLVAVRPASGRQFMLASVSWIMAGFDAKLQIGVSLLPGPPSAIAFRNAGATMAKEHLRPGFLLPALAALKEPDSVILPAGWFRTARTVEFEDGISSYQIRMLRLLERGTDYDRATYEEVVTR